MSQPEDLSRWQGRIDAFIETTLLRVDTLFKGVEVTTARIELLDDERTKEIAELSSELRKELTNLSVKFSNLSARLAVIAAVGSFVGTVVTSLFVASIIKIFLK